MEGVHDISIAAALFSSPVTPSHLPPIPYAYPGSNDKTHDQDPPLSIHVVSPNFRQKWHFHNGERSFDCGRMPLPTPAFPRLPTCFPVCFSYIQSRKHIIGNLLFSSI